MTLILINTLSISSRFESWTKNSTKERKLVSLSWLYLHMMTSSNGNIFRVTGPLCGEFTGPGDFPTQRPVAQSFDVFFDLWINDWVKTVRLVIWDAIVVIMTSLWWHQLVFSNFTYTHRQNNGCFLFLEFWWIPFVSRNTILQQCLWLWVHLNFQKYIDFFLHSP